MKVGQLERDLRWNDATDNVVSAILTVRAQGSGLDLSVPGQMLVAFFAELRGVVNSGPSEGVCRIIENFRVNIVLANMWGAGRVGLMSVALQGDVRRGWRDSQRKKVFRRTDTTLARIDG